MTGGSDSETKPHQFYHHPREGSIAVPTLGSRILVSHLPSKHFRLVRVGLTDLGNGKNLHNITNHTARSAFPKEFNQFMEAQSFTPH